LPRPHFPGYSAGLEHVLFVFSADFRGFDMGEHGDIVVFHPLGLLQNLLFDGQKT